MEAVTYCHEGDSSTENVDGSHGTLQIMKCTPLALEWKFLHFCYLEEGSVLTSEEFSFADAIWFLRMHRRATIENDTTNSAGSIQLTLQLVQKHATNKLYRIEYKIGVKTCTGMVYKSFEQRFRGSRFDNNEVLESHEICFPIELLQPLKTTEPPTLHTFCIMRHPNNKTQDVSQVAEYNRK